MGEHLHRTEGTEDTYGPTEPNCIHSRQAAEPVPDTKDRTHHLFCTISDDYLFYFSSPLSNSRFVLSIITPSR